MNATKTLEKLHGIAELLPEDEKYIFDFVKSTKNTKDFSGMGARLAALVIEASDEIRHDAAKATGNASRQKAAERVIKNAISCNPTREALRGAWTDSKGLQCFCDGFQAYRLREALPLVTIPEKVTPLDLTRIIAENDGDVLPLPTVPELKAYIKTEKAKKKAAGDRSGVIYDFGEDFPAVNANYLLDVLEILPDCTTTIISKRAPLVSALYFKSEYGEGVLFPVRKDAKK